MDILARPARGRAVANGDFADITAVMVTSVDWDEDGQLRVTFERDLTAEEQLAVRLRITSRDADDERQRVAAARFLSLKTPTLEDAVAQLQQLTLVALSLDDQV